MSLRDCFLSALISLRANILRSILTTLGIIIGVAAVIVIVAIGSGFENRVTNVISSLGSNILIVMPGSQNSGGVRGGTGTQMTLTEDDAHAIATEVEGVAYAAPSVRTFVQVVAANLNWQTQVEGTTPALFPAREWELDDGRWLTESDVRGAVKAAMIGQTVAKNLFPDGGAIGSVIRINRVPHEVVAVLKSKGQTTFGQDQDDIIFIPISTAKKRVIGRSRFSGNLVAQITVKGADEKDLAGVEERIKELLRQRHKLAPGEADDFNVRNLSQMLEAQASITRTATFFLGAIASISLLVGGIGIMNIMLVTVTERTKEIGLRMAVGARQRDIRLQFLVEAGTLSLMGGMIGIVLGVLLSVAITLLAGWSLYVSPWSILTAFLFSAGTGVFFGWYPALTASRLDPIEALRTE